MAAAQAAISRAQAEADTIRAEADAKRVRRCGIAEHVPGL
jgi:hypothetical protein